MVVSEIGNSLFENQRFVVQKMVCPIVLGIDFWSRIDQLAFEFIIQQASDDYWRQWSREPLLAHPGVNGVAAAEQEDQGNDPIQVLVKETVTIPAGNEMLLECDVPRMEKGRDYLVQPVTSEDDMMVSTPYGLIAGSKSKVVCIRVANLSTEETTLEKGAWIATLDRESWVKDAKAGSAFKRDNQKDDFNWKSMCCSDLGANKTSQLIDLLKKHKSVFYDGNTLPIVRVGVEHTIKLKEDTSPTAFRPRRLSKELADEVREHIDKLMKDGVIRESNSPWASPIVCARKADGSLRLVIDYRCTNAKSLTATLHPIPLIEDLLDRLAKAKYFSILDAKSGYHQMPLKEEDSEVTAFVVPWGHYEFAERTPFGLKGAGYSFQRMMSAILGDSNFVEALCYLDDVLVWGETWEIHEKRLRKVLSKIEEAGLALAAGKCKFGLREVSYLGCTIKKGMLSVNEQRVEQMRNIVRPENVRELRRALGAFAYVQRWLPGLSEIAKPLYDTITGKPYSRLKWTTEMDESFKKMKEMIGDAVSLNLPDMERRFILVTDCSNMAAGAMLSQESLEESGLLKPVAFYHHTLNPSEQKYSATEKELVAVVLAVKKFRVYLGKEFTLVTDHQALRWLESLNPENETGRRGRWLDFLQQFGMTIVPKRGKSPAMSIADYLSRVRCDGSCPQDGEMNAQVSAVAAVDGGVTEIIDDVVARSEIIEAQANDQSIRKVIDAFQNSQDINPGGSDSRDWRVPSTTNDPVVTQLWKYRERLFVDDDGLLRLTFNGGRRSGEHPYGETRKNRIIIPKTFGKRLMPLLHDSATGAHMGGNRTWVRARDNFWWPDMKSDIEQYVKACDLCSRNKHLNHPNKAPMAKTSMPGKPLEEVMIDFLGPFQSARTHSFKYVLQIQDVFSRFLLLIPCEDATMRTAARILVNNWVCLFGVMQKLRSDRGTHFTGGVFEEVCRQLGIKHKFGSPEHPESQGQVERQNQLLNHVRCLCENDIETWHEALFRVQCSHNSSKNAATGISPARLILGKEMTLPDDMIAEESQRREQEPVDSLIRRREAEDEAVIEEARSNVAETQQKRFEKNTVSEGMSSSPYKVGDLVRYKLNKDVRSKHGGKLAPRYSGVHRITDVKDSGFTYSIAPTTGNTTRVKDRHFNLLKTVERTNGVNDPVDDPAEDPANDPAGPVDDVVRSTPLSEASEDESEVMNMPWMFQQYVRRSVRRTTQQRHMQADGKQKTYGERSPLGVEDGTSEGSEEDPAT